MALQLKRVSCWVIMIPYCERRTHLAICCLNSVCLILGNGLANGQTRPILKTVGSTQQDCQTLLRLQNAETTQLDGMLRSLALSSRLLVVPPSSTNDSMIPLDYQRACSISEHRLMIGNLSSTTIPRSCYPTRKSSNLKSGVRVNHTTADMGTTPLESREGRVPLEYC
jgi:hypothetical protein